MSAVLEDLTIEQGVTWSTGWNVLYGNSVETLAPIDASWSAKAEIRTKQDKASELLYEFPADVDAEGNVVIGVAFADSEVWAWLQAYYDVEVTNNDQSVRLRVAMGKVKISREVTE